MTGVKFNFDNDFEADKEKVAEDEAAILERQLRERFEAGYKDGFSAGETSAAQAVEERIAELMESAVASLATLGAKHAEMADRLERNSVQLAFMVAKKLASAALDKYPASEIEAMIRECFEVGREESKLVVRVAEDLIETVAAKCEEIRARSSFSGEVIVIGDPDIGRNDCTVEWPDGGAEHRTDTSLDAIEHLIQDFLFQRPGDDVVAVSPVEAAVAGAADDQSTFQEPVPAAETTETAESHAAPEMPDPETTEQSEAAN